MNEIEIIEHRGLGWRSFGYHVRLEDGVRLLGRGYASSFEARRAAGTAIEEHALEASQPAASASG